MAKRPILFLTALVALLLSTLAPAGFMPVWGANGLTIELCSGVADAEQRISPDDPRYAALKLVHGSDEDEQSQPKRCDFAMADSLAAPPPAPIIASASPVVAPRPLMAPASAFLTQHRHLPPATGPPSLS